MGYLRGFIPWIVSGVVSSFDWRWGAMGGLVTGLLLLLQDRRRGVDLDALVLEISAIMYFVVVGAVAVTDPDSVLADHTDVISFGWLAATAWGTTAIRRPFTLGIARRQTPREYWDMPEFIRVNNHITTAWGAGFTFIAVSLAVCGRPRRPGLGRHLRPRRGPRRTCRLHEGPFRPGPGATAGPGVGHGRSLTGGPLRRAPAASRGRRTHRAKGTRRAR
ncbi:hypothetical protein QF035_009497 [Streptomyces umbrinus]|uniref:Uncharacterized protein n=1 Tax=Streptomyces umbrinus TaxID=67370 RepID=A0ABU0T7X6_9ACTN|nr:hypothetical protein [Streptomyces umbrinus]MDQ1031915.1 hypothetical protein [Streptomyces umbrinus]